MVRSVTVQNHPYGFVPKPLLLIGAEVVFVARQPWKAAAACYEIVKLAARKVDIHEYKSAIRNGGPRPAVKGRVPSELLLRKVPSPGRAKRLDVPGGRGGGCQFR